MSYFIAIAGNIGVGKSTLTERLGTKLGWEIYLEPTTQNPYLADFYKDMQRWGFHSQVFFLTHRLQQHIDLLHAQNTVVQDRSVYENAEVFARNLYEKDLLSERDWQTYQQIYQNLIDLVPPPNLIVYLRATVPTLRRRIELRGREYERRVPTSYLAELNQLYDRWTRTFTIAPIMTVNTDAVNFVEDETALDTLVHEIENTLPVRQLPLYKKRNGV
ncbi:MAG: deoxynucleoside kinase [Patescibacteria group bacterium]